MTISNQLRAALRGTGLSVRAIAKECGVPQPMLTRFLNGKDIALGTADRVAAYFKLELQAKSKRANKQAAATKFARSARETKSAAKKLRPRRQPKSTTARSQ